VARARYFLALERPKFYEILRLWTYSETDDRPNVVPPSRRRDFIERRTTGRRLLFIFPHIGPDRRDEFYFRY